MSKSILVIDTPDGCSYCPFHRYPVFCGIKCRSVMNTMFDKSGTDRPDSEFPKWCPLRDLPIKIEEENRGFGKNYAIGFNACIDEILKGVNGNE